MSMSELLNGTLKCPSCASDDLHHDRVTTYSRGEDQGVDVRVVEVPDENLEENSFRGGLLPNPSRRRSGVVIEGWCEGCENRWTLTLAQHKGQTGVEFRGAQTNT